MSEFDRSQFNRQEFGSTQITPGAGLVATGKATAAIASVRRRTAAISAGCISTTSVLVTRIHRAVLTLAGTLHAAIEPHRRKPVAIAAHGAASAAITIVRRRISHSSLTGRLLASMGHAVTFSRGVASTGIAHASIRLVRIALPAPVTTGLRVGPWTRPAANSNLRFTGWTAPV
jgi:hypothetical protein